MPENTPGFFAGFDLGREGMELDVDAGRLARTGYKLGLLIHDKPTAVTVDPYQEVFEADSKYAWQLATQSALGVNKKFLSLLGLAAHLPEYYPAELYEPNPDASEFPETLLYRFEAPREKAGNELQLLAWNRDFVVGSLLHSGGTPLCLPEGMSSFTCNVQTAVRGYTVCVEDIKVRYTAWADMNQQTRPATVKRLEPGSITVMCNEASFERAGGARKDTRLGALEDLIDYRDFETSFVPDGRVMIALNFLGEVEGVRMGYNREIGLRVVKDAHINMQSVLGQLGGAILETTQINKTYLPVSL